MPGHVDIVGVAAKCCNISFDPTNRLRALLHLFVDTRRWNKRVIDDDADAALLDKAEGDVRAIGFIVTVPIATVTVYLHRRIFRYRKEDIEFFYAVLLVPNIEIAR